MPCAPNVGDVFLVIAMLVIRAFAGIVMPIREKILNATAQPR